MGDFIDGRGVFAPTLELGALRAAVEAVHAVGGRLAIHAMTAGAIEMAIEAGVDSIEHATELAPEHLPAIARKGIALVPTMLIREPILDTARGMGLPDGEQRRWEEALDRQPEMVRRACSLDALRTRHISLGAGGRRGDEQQARGAGRIASPLDRATTLHQTVDLRTGCQR